MCGRVRLSSDVSKIKLVFSIPPHRPTPNFPPTWNGAPCTVASVFSHYSCWSRMHQLTTHSPVLEAAVNPEALTQAPGTRFRRVTTPSAPLGQGDLPFAATTG